MDDGGTSAEGKAALAVLDSLLITLAEKRVLSGEEVGEVLEGAAGALEAAADQGSSAHRDRHRRAAQLVRRILARSDAARS